MCKPWMWTIHRLGCSKHGSMLAQTIHRLIVQSVDCAKQTAQSMNSDNPVILMYTGMPYGRLFEQADVAR